MREKEAGNTYEGGQGGETITVYGSTAYGGFLFPTSVLLATTSFSARWMDPLLSQLPFHKEHWYL